MAFTHFYMQAGGSDLNAGSDLNNAAAYTAVNGNWNEVAGVYTPTDGSTPASSIAVGDYVSVYPDAASVALFIAQVTVVAAGVNGAITVDATIRYGSAPSTAATGRSLKAGGAWASPSILVNGTGAFGSPSPVPQDTKVNIKDSTYVRAASDSWQLRASTAGFLWIDGYHATPGDLDADVSNSLAKPVISYAAGFGVTLNNESALVSNLSFLGDVNGNLAASGNTTAGQKIVRCRFENISSGAGACTVSLAVVAITFAYCWFKTPVTATGASVFTTASGVTMIGCVCEGGGAAGFHGTSVCLLTACVALSSGTIGFDLNPGSSVFALLNCTAAGCGADGIKIGSASTSASAIVGCLLVSNGGWGINVAAASVTIALACNDFYGNVSGEITGVGLVPDLFEQLESASPIANSTNPTLVPGAKALQNGFPGVFENEAFSSFVDCGAVQAVGSTTGGNPSAFPFVG